MTIRPIHLKGRKTISFFSLPNSTKCYAHFIVFFLIFSGSVMWNYISFAFWQKKILVLALAFFCMISIVVNRKITESAIIFVTAIGILLMVYIAVTREYIKTYIATFMIPFLIFILFCMVYIRNKKIHYFIEAYGNIMTFFAAISLFFWVFGSVFHILSGTAKLIYHWADTDLQTVTYYFLYFENPAQAVNRFGIDIIRNTGICPESPGYSSLLLYALIVELYYRKVQKRSHVVILVLTILSTISTKGVFFLLEILLLNYLVLNQKKTVLQKFIKIFGVCILILGVMICGYYLLSQKVGGRSFSMRIEDINATLITWLHHPLFGCGFGNAEEIVSHIKTYRENNGLSMGLLVLLAQGGLWLFAMYLGGFVLPYLKQKDQRIRGKILVVFLLILTDIFISNVQFQPYFIFVLSLGYGYGLRKKSEVTTEQIKMFTYRNSFNILRR